jgi:hypothetical protein
MKKLLLLLLFPLCLYGQSTNKVGLQEVRYDTLRPNHYGPSWGMMTAFHDTVVVKTYRDSVVFYPGGHRTILVNASGITNLDTTRTGMLKVGPSSAALMDTIAVDGTYLRFSVAGLYE